jgi:hypothetical protein
MKGWWKKDENFRRVAFSSDSKTKFLDKSLKNFPPCYSQSPLLTIKSENYQDYAQKPQRNCTFMNSASAMKGLCNEILSHSTDKPSLDTKMIHRTKIHITYSNSNECSVVFCKHCSKTFERIGRPVFKNDLLKSQDKFA